MECDRGHAAGGQTWCGFRRRNKFVSKEFRAGKTRIKVNGTEIGGAEISW